MFVLLVVLLLFKLVTCLQTSCKFSHSRHVFHLWRLESCYRNPCHVVPWCGLHGSFQSTFRLLEFKSAKAVKIGTGSILISDNPDLHAWRKQHGYMVQYLTGCFGIKSRRWETSDEGMHQVIWLSFRRMTRQPSRDRKKKVKVRSCCAQVLPNVDFDITECETSKAAKMSLLPATHHSADLLLHTFRFQFQKESSSNVEVSKVWHNKRHLGNHA